MTIWVLTDNTGNRVITTAHDPKCEPWLLEESKKPNRRLFGLEWFYGKQQAIEFHAIPEHPDTRWAGKRSPA